MFRSGPAPGPEEHNGSSWDCVSPHFFETIGQPVLRGRGLTEQDTPTSQLYGVHAYDPLTLFIAVVALGASAAIAGFIPARRAASIEPMQALRIE